MLERHRYRHNRAITLAGRNLIGGLLELPIHAHIPINSHARTSSAHA
jgi:hypothetical protein